VEETGPARRAAEELTWLQQHARPCCAAKRQCVWHEMATASWHNLQWNYRHCVCTTPQTEDFTTWAVEIVRTMLSAATTAQFFCLAVVPRDRASNTRDWPFGADHTISRRTPDPSSRPSNPFLHLEGRESTLDRDPRNEKTASSQLWVSTLQPRVRRWNAPPKDGIIALRSATNCSIPVF